ncbi:hypothetical protein ACHWQZ_G000429 [Mnemiopsis leidyi]
MRPLFLKTLHYIRKNKVRSSLIGGAVCVSVGVPVYVYNAQINIEKVATALVRTGRAVGAVGRAAVFYKYQTWGLLEDQDISQIHESTAEAIRDMCSVNGGLFIKVGQHIGTLDYLLPKEYVKAFKVLHNKAPESSLDSVMKVLKSELGAPPDKIFSEFDPTPLGSASLAQVHRAVLRSSNKEVAVKVQHSTVQEHSKIDTIVIEFLAKALDKVFPEFEFDWLIDTIKRNLPKELDFVQEGQNCEHVSRLFTDTPFLKVPKIHWEFTSRRVLCMEYINGGKVDDAGYMQQHGINKSEVLSYLSKIFSQMIFVRGYIHCDPHPGNVLVQKCDGKTLLVLLDHGLYQSLTDDFRINYCKLWQALLNGDTDRIKTQADRLGVGKYYGLFACMVASRTWDDITGSGIADKNSNLDVNRLQEQAVKQIPEISQVLNYIPRQLILILKTNDLLRGIECSLLDRNTQGVGTFLNMARYCLSALTTHRLHKSASLRRKVQMVGDEVRGEDKSDHVMEDLKNIEFVRSVDMQLIEDRTALQAEVVRWCTAQIRKSNERNPFAPPDANKYFKDKLCELQIQVLERSKLIAQLQARLTELIINCPESAAALQDLKRTMDSVNFRRETNKYGYGQDVVKIACDAVDSVKCLVDQVPCDLATVKETDKERIYRSLSENAAYRTKRGEGKRTRSLSTNHVVSSSTMSSGSSGFHSNSTQIPGYGDQTVDIRALSNLEMNDSGL